MSIKFIDALEHALARLKQPVVSDYTIFVQAYKIDTFGAYEGQPLYRQKNPFSRKKALSLIGELKTNKIIRKDRDFSRSIYRVNEVPDGSADVICSFVDPFCYLSHLTAMRRYGLTDRIPASITISTPYRELWNELRDKQLASDFPHRQDIDHIPFKQISFPERVRDIKIDRHETKYPATTLPIQDSPVRISAIGSTFVDMLDKPSLCGGMEHVMEVWRNHASTYLEEIIPAITACPKKIIKVRAGYIMDEVLHIRDNRVEQWGQAAQRGSSQVLDPEKPFRSTFSEKWMLSLNV